MLTDERGKTFLSGYVQFGRTALQKIAERLTADKFKVNKEILAACFAIKSDRNGQSIGSPLENLIEERLKGYDYTQVEAVRERCNRMINDIAIIVNNFDNAHPDRELDKYLFELIEIQNDGSVSLVPDSSQKIAAFASVNFETQEAVDIANQHAHVADELQKLYNMMNAQAKKQLAPEDLFSVSFDGKVGIEEFNYNVIV